MKSVLLAMLICTSLVANTFAARINGVTSTTNNGVGTISVSSPGAALTGSAAGYTTVDELDLDAGSPAVIDNTVNVTLDYTARGTMSATFSTLGNGTLVGNARVHMYRFNVTINNNELFGKAIPTFRITVNPGTGPQEGIADPLDNNGVIAVNPGATFNDTGWNGSFLSGIHYIGADEIRFGGLNGGGGGIPNGGSTVVRFLLYSPGAGANGNFTLNFTASPEPTSLALAGAALAGFGGVVARRRRKNNS